MQKHINKIAAGLLTAVMMLPTAVSTAEPMITSASEILGESTFDLKILPWHFVEADPAKQDFELKDGAVHITIRCPEGADREKWDLQFRHRNLNFRKGHEYKVSFRAKSKRNGMELTSKIGNIKGDEEYFELDGRTNDMHMGPHMGGEWPNAAVKLSTEWQTYEGIFIPTKDLEACEWCFQYAKGTKYQGNADVGDEIWFDDMSIYDTSDESDDTICTPPPTNGYTMRYNSGLLNNYISVNQLGYYTGLEKIATLGDDKGDFTCAAKPIELKSAYDYEIVRVSDDTVVYKGQTSEPKEDFDSGDTVCRIDFTDFNEEGEYYIRIKDKEWRSFPFKIGNNIYSDPENDILTNALNYFYQNRSGIAIDKKYITSGEKDKLAHKGGHKTDTGTVQTRWLNEYLNNNEAEVTYASSTLDASGGWYASGDHTKDLKEGGISVWTLQNMYERAIQTDAGLKKFKDGSGTVVVPETGNEYPDILDECRYELDFMSKMKVQPDEKTWGEYAGLYYQRIQENKHTGLAVRPWDYEQEYETVRIIRPPTFAATLNYAACAAQGARLWAPYDAEYANELMERAKEAYASYKKNWYEDSPFEEGNPMSLYERNYRWRSSYIYSDIEVASDAYWAACELFISANELNDPDAESYYTDLTGYKTAFMVNTMIMGGENLIGDGSYTMFNSGNTASAGSLSLLLHKELLSDEQINTLNSSVISAADSFINTEENQGYGIPYIYADPTLVLPNGRDYYVRRSGFEKNSNERAVNNMIAMAYAYDISGDVKYLNGIAKGMDYMLGNNPMAFSFITGYGSYHAKNPTHRYWSYEIDKTLPQAPDGVLVSGPTADAEDVYMRLLGIPAKEPYKASERFYADFVESWSSNEASLSSNASLAWVVSFLQDEAPTVKSNPVAKGDVNADGVFNLADIVLVQRWLLGSVDAKLINWKAVDFCRDNKLDVFDLCLMRKALLENTYLPVSLSITETGGYAGVHRVWNVYKEDEKFILSYDDQKSNVDTELIIVEISETDYREIMSQDYDGIIDKYINSSHEQAWDGFNHKTILAYAKGEEKETSADMTSILLKLDALLEKYLSTKNKI